MFYYFGGKMKKTTLIILFACICCAWGQEYIEINCERALNNDSSEKTNIRLDFDKNGYLSRYLNTTHIGKNVIVKEIQGKWKITAFEKNGEKEYGPYKIRTDAFRYVEAWEQYTDEYGEVNWRKRKDKEGNIIKSKDAGLLIHGGGYSKSNLDNKKGANKYVDNTLGCIRISNLDVLLIVEILNTYMSIKKSISLEVI